MFYKRKLHGNRSYAASIISWKIQGGEMVKGKMKEELSPEKKLEQALVPAKEQPYEVPENWCWVRLCAVANLLNGDRGKNYPNKKDYVKKGIPFINAGTIENGYVNISQSNFITQEKYDALSSGKIQKMIFCIV